jgi:hypothetical protein
MVGIVLTPAALSWAVLAAIASGGLAFLGFQWLKWYFEDDSNSGLKLCMQSVIGAAFRCVCNDPVEAINTTRELSWCMAVGMGVAFVATFSPALTGAGIGWLWHKCKQRQRRKNQLLGLATEKK